MSKRQLFECQVVKFVAFILSAAFFVTAKALTATGATPFMAARCYTSADGLPSNTINCLAQDNRGYIWAGTNSGLCRFDGYSFVTFTNIAGDGREIDQRIAFTINDSTTGKVHIVMSDESDCFFDTQSGHFIDYKTIQERGRQPKPKSPHPDITGNEGYFVAQLQKYECWADKDKLWLFDKQGLYKELRLIDNANLTWNKRQKYFICDIAPETVAIGTYGNGLFILNTANGEMTHLRADDPMPQIPSNYITAITADKGGTLWAGTEYNGLVRLSPLTGTTIRRILPVPQATGGKANAIRALEINSDGTIEAGTMENHIFECKGESPACTDKGDFGAMIYSIFTDSKGHEWIAARGSGLFVDGVRYYKDSETHTIPTNIIYDIEEGKDGTIYIATWKKGLLTTRYEEGKPLVFKEFLTQNNKLWRIHDIFRGEDGSMWFATCGGIVCLPEGEAPESNDDFDYYSVESGTVPGDEIVSIITTKDNKYLWASAIGKGLVKANLENGKITKTEVIDRSNGLPNNVVSSIVEDKEGNIWAATEYGLALIDNNAERITTLIPPQGRSAGGSSFTECTAVAAPDGTLLFGTIEGIVEISNGSRLTHAHTQSPVITDITVNGTSLLNMKESPISSALEATEGITLSHNQNMLTVYFSDLDYANAGSTLYEYQLDGFDKSWRAATSLNHAEYSELPPGKYTFRVRHFGKDDEKTIKLKIKEPWYNTWMAWILWLAIIGTIALLFYRSWRRNFELHQKIILDGQINEMRQNFFTHVTHEFRTPLAIIQTAVQKMEGDIKQGKMPKKAADTVKRGSQRMMKLVNQFIDFRKSESGKRRLQVEKADIVKLLRQLHQDFITTAQSKEISLSFIPQTSKLETLIDKDAVETVVYNLLSNALKYTPAKGTVEMRLRQDDNGINITVEDNGPGISEERQQHLFKPFMHGYVSQGGMGIGLALSQQLAALHHGKLEYSNSKDLGGSRFTLTLPSSDDAYSAEEYKAPEAVAATTEEKSEDIRQIYREMLPEAINSQKVAIIEDDPDMMLQLKEEIAPFFQVSTYMNGKEGCQGILDNAPDLLICDVMLPGMNGYDIVKTLRKDEKAAGKEPLPVIMLTALDDESHQIRGYEAGADDYMVKPCNINVLLVRMAQLIKWRLERMAAEQAKTEVSSANISAPEGSAGEASTAGTAGSNSATGLTNGGNAATTATAAPIISRKDKQLKDKIETLVARNLDNPTFSVDRLAEMCHIGRTTFYGKMKELMGMSPNKYLQEQRMLTAARLIEEGELTITEIIDKVGIQDASYFYKCFKAKFGVPPSKY